MPLEASAWVTTVVLPPHSLGQSMSHGQAQSQWGRELYFVHREAMPKEEMSNCEQKCNLL